MSSPGRLAPPIISDATGTIAIEITNMITTEMYLNFIRNAVQTDGIYVTDIANKLALDMKAITLDQYLKAAHILVAAKLAEN